MEKAYIPIWSNRGTSHLCVTNVPHFYCIFIDSKVLGGTSVILTQLFMYIFNDLISVLISHSTLIYETIHHIIYVIN